MSYCLIAVKTEHNEYTNKMNYEIEKEIGGKTVVLDYSKRKGGHIWKTDAETKTREIMEWNLGGRRINRGNKN